VGRTVAGAGVFIGIGVWPWVITGAGDRTGPGAGERTGAGVGLRTGAGERSGAGEGERTGPGTGERTAAVVLETTGAGERRGAGEGERTGTDEGRSATGVGAGTVERRAAGERRGTGVGAGTVLRTIAGRTEAGALVRTTLGAGGATVVCRGIRAGATTGCVTASCFTITGVPTGALLKNGSAIPAGRRMQPWEAA
jgi:hypothetical protein